MLQSLVVTFFQSTHLAFPHSLTNAKYSKFSTRAASARDRPNSKRIAKATADAFIPDLLCLWFELSGPIVGNITPVLRHCRHLPAWHSADNVLPSCGDPARVHGRGQTAAAAGSSAPSTTMS